MANPSFDRLLNKAGSVVQVITDFSPQNVANLLWAAVQFEQPLGVRTLSRLSAAAMKKIQGTSPVTIAGLLSAYSKLADVSGKEVLFVACVEEVSLFCCLTRTSRTLYMQSTFHLTRRKVSQRWTWTTALRAAYTLYTERTRV